jgi:DNA-binding transcriptional ArsR family regulator
MQKDSTNGVGPGQNMRFSDIVIDDPKLSLAAKGVFSMLGLMGNSCSVDELTERTSDGEPTVRAALDELERAGYVEVAEGLVRVQSAGSFGVVP